MEKNKFVLKCFLGHFECFKQLFFLEENWPILTPLPPPPLVENSTIFFIFETFPVLLEFKGTYDPDILV